MGREARSATAAIALAVVVAVAAASCGGSGGEQAGRVATGPTPQEMCGSGQTPALAAYDLRTGVYQWSTCAPMDRERRDVVDVTSDEVTLRTIVYRNGVPSTTTVVDARTGETVSTTADDPVGSRRTSCGADPDIAGVVVDGVCISGGQDDPMVVTDVETRKVLWRRPDAHPVYDDVWAVGDGAVYAIDGPLGAQPTLAAFDVRTGRTRWRRSGAPYADAAPWIVKDGTLYCIWNNLNLVSTADGSVRWHTEFPAAEFPRITGVRANADQVFVAFSPIASDGD